MGANRIDVPLLALLIQLVLLFDADLLLFEHLVLEGVVLIAALLGLVGQLGMFVGNFYLFLKAFLF